MNTSFEPTLLVPGPHFSTTRLLCCDVDGVLTDGGFYYDSEGKALLRFHVADGTGLKRLQDCGIRTCFISQSVSGPIQARARDLGIDYCFTGIDDKLSTIAALSAETGIALGDMVHIADDINDATLLKAVGTPVTVPNAVPEVKRMARFITRTAGGRGAVRELCDAIIASK